MQSCFPRVVLGSMLALVLVGAGNATAQTHSGGDTHGQMAQAHHGADGSGHDEINMPGLRGLNATPEESAEIGLLFRGFQTIERSVENLPNGIRTITYSSHAAVMEALVSHVTGMIGRVETGDNPLIMIQSPTLDIFFERGAELVTEIDVTDEGIVVLQTSDDADLVEAMHTHAAEVSAMADRGMQAVHEMMMQRHHGS